MWKDYYEAIYNTLFTPFLLYFLSFTLFATTFGSYEGTSFNFLFLMKWVCLVIFGKTFITFLMLEIIQFKDDPFGYFTDFWNLLDFASLISCASYIYFELFKTIPNGALNLLGSVAVVLLWVKLFYWLRLFKPFSAFIRIISEIMKDI